MRSLFASAMFLAGALAQQDLPLDAAIEEPRNLDQETEAFLTESERQLGFDFDGTDGDFFDGNSFFDDFFSDSGDDEEENGENGEEDDEPECSWDEDRIEDAIDRCEDRLERDEASAERKAYRVQRYLRRKDRDLYDATSREDIYAAAKAYFDNDPTINEAYPEPFWDNTYNFFWNDDCEEVLAT